jgi:myosin heavy subunit
MKELQILARYVEKTYSPVLFDDPESLILYLNTHDFAAKEVTLTELTYARKNPINGTLSDAQKEIVDRYAAFMMPRVVQTVNSQDGYAMQSNAANQLSSSNQSNRGLDDVGQKLAAVAKQQAQGISGSQVHNMLNPYIVLEKELDDIAKRRSDLLEKEKQLLQLQSALDQKEEVLLSRKVTPQIQKFIDDFDSKISHYKSLLGQYQAHASEFNRSEQERDQQYQSLAIDIVSLSRDKKKLEGDVAKLTRQIDSLSTQLVKSSALLEDKEKQVRILSEESERVSEHLLTRKNLLDRKEAELTDLTTEAKEMHTSAVRLKEEYLQKQRDLRVHEAQLVRTYDSIEHLLKQKYEQRVRELDDHYTRKLQELTHYAEEQALKLQHLERKEEMMMRREKELQVLRGEAELIKNQNQHAHQNLLKTVNSISQIAHSNQRHSVIGESQVIHKLAQLSDEISDVPVINGTIAESSIERGSSNTKSVEILYEIAHKEVKINPHLAYKTYKKLHELYNVLPVPLKTEWYPKLVKLHMSIIEHGKSIRKSNN